MDLTAYFRRLFAYETECSRRVIDSLARAEYAIEHGGEAAEAAPFVRAVEIFAHIQAARRTWLHRLGSASAAQDGLFPSWPLERAVKESGLMDSAWTSYIEGVTAADLDRRVPYTTTGGEPMESVLCDILTHVVNHSSYHRGQIASLVGACGAEPAVTDFIVFTRTDAG